MEWILIVPLVLSFSLCFVFLPWWIEKCKKIGLVWEDMNKYHRPKNVAASGGIIVVMSFVIGVLSYIALRTFFRNESNGTNLEMFSALTVILMVSIVGLTDDLLGWNNGGLSKRGRLLLVFASSIPLMVINAGTSIINVPFFGVLNLGILYPLILIPLGVAGAGTTFNFLAGFNGLESGLGIIILSFLSYVAFVTGTPWLALFGITMVMPLLVFFWYNKFPAKVFPGDILTYTIGAMIALMAILGNFEKIAVFVFIPVIIEVILKARGKLKKQSFGIPDKKGNLDLPYGKIYGLTHLSIYLIKKFKGRVKEWEVSYLIFVMEIFVCLLALLFFIR